MASLEDEQACTVGPRASGTHKDAGSGRSEKLLVVELQQVWTKEHRQQYGKCGRKARKRCPTELTYDLRVLFNADSPRSLMRAGCCWLPYGLEGLPHAASEHTDCSSTTTFGFAPCRSKRNLTQAKLLVLSLSSQWFSGSAL